MRTPLSLLLALVAGAVPRVTAAAPTLELYGTFESMGVIVTLEAGDDDDGDAVASVTSRAGGAAFAAGFPLTRVAADRFVGSLFWLEPGTTYDVQVSFSDSDGPLDGVVLAGAAATRDELVVPPAAATWVVAPSGSGTACSVASPCSLAQGIASATAGDHVVLLDGTYRVGELEVWRSGSAGAPIVLRADDGAAPVLDGSDPQVFTWSHQGDGVWSTTVNVADPHLVVADGERLYPYQSASDLANLAWGVPGFYASGTSVSVRLAGDADPNTREMRVSRFNHAFTVTGDFVYLIGLSLLDYGQGDYAKGVYLDGASDCLIRHCTFHRCDLGVGIKRDSHRNVIEDNDFSDTIFDWPWEAVKAGSGLETGGVRLYTPMTGRGTVIRRNTFHDDFDGFGVCQEDDPGATSETDVYDNLGFDLGDDGLETDGWCSNLRIWGNTFHDVLIGISLAPVYEGPVYAIRNLVYRTGEGNNSYSGSAFKLNSGYGASGPMYLFHNTSDAALPDNDGLAIKSPGAWAALVSRNNMWSGTRYALSNANPTQPVDLDWDDLYTTLPGELVYWDGLPDRHLNTLAEVQSATGQELHGLSVPPGFSDAAAGDYTLAPTSSLVDAGLVIPGINDGFEGLAPDLGALESSALLFADDFESGTTSAWSSVLP